MHSEVEHRWWVEQLGQLENLQKESVDILSQIKSQSHSFKGDNNSATSTHSSEELGPPREASSMKLAVFQDDFNWNPTNEEVQRFLDGHNAKKAELIEEGKKYHFSYDMKQTETEAERTAGAKLQKIMTTMELPALHNVSIRNCFREMESQKKSLLYRVLDCMPKGGLHHIHTTAGPPVEAFLAICDDPVTYFNERANLLKVFPDHVPEPGYEQCILLKKTDPHFEEKMRKRIVLTEDESLGLDSHDVWGFFQHKFSLCKEVSKYKPFFMNNLRANLMACIKQNIDIVELRHTTGSIFDEQKVPIPLMDELVLIQGLLDELKQDYPHFELALIISSYKAVGQSHVDKMIGHYAIAKDAYPDLITGFDMVNEEDFTPCVAEFLPSIAEAQLNQASASFHMPCVFHAGETHERESYNLHDAVLMGSKRIGHGFQLNMFPNLMQQVIEKEICIESCPLSNLLLGYTLDLRTHPVRYMLHHGVQASLSSDNPGFFGYEGVTLDFFYATLAWQLDLMDLKKICYNGIKHSTVPDRVKQNLLDNVFPRRWAEFVRYLNEEVEV